MGWVERNQTCRQISEKLYVLKGKSRKSKEEFDLIQKIREGGGNLINDTD